MSIADVIKLLLKSMYLICKVRHKNSDAKLLSIYIID